MPLELDSAAPGFRGGFREILAAKRELAADVDLVVAAIIDDVRANGDTALIEHTKRLDRLELTAATLRVTDAEIDAAATACAPAALDGAAFRQGADRGLSPPPASRRSRLHRRRRREARLALGRSAPSGSMFPAAPRPIRPRC